MAKRHIVELKRFIEKCPEIRSWLLREVPGLLIQLSRSEAVDMQELNHILSLLNSSYGYCRGYRHETRKLCNSITLLHAWHIFEPFDLIVVYDEEEKRIVAWKY